MIAAALTAAFLMFASPALAMHCYPREVWVKNLADDYGEKPVRQGLTANGSVLEVFATPDGSTWTLIITRPDRVSCGIASGKHWRKTVPKLLKPTGLPI